MPPVSLAIFFHVTSRAYVHALVKEVEDSGVCESWDHLGNGMALGIIKIIMESGSSGAENPAFIPYESLSTHVVCSDSALKVQGISHHIE